MKHLRLVVPVLSVLAFSSCPSTGVVCMAGTTRCGNGCADFQTDPRNCGACGQSCLAGQVCTSGQCQCRTGTEPCSGSCVVTQSDPKFCGRCENACASGQVCEMGACRGACSAGTTKCGFGCAVLNDDPNNCGACGNVCPDQQSCHAGACQYDLVAACLSTGQVAGIRSGADVRGPLKPLGSGPISLGRYGQVLLAVDTGDSRLVQARLPSLDRIPEFNVVGSQSNHVLVDAPFAYVTNSGSHTVQILGPAGDAGCPPVVQPDAGCAYVGLDDGGSALPMMADAGCFYPAVTDGGCADALQEDGGLGPFTLEDAGCFVVPRPPPPPQMPCFMSGADGGLQLVTLGQVDTGANTFPQSSVKVGSSLWVPLYGGLFADYGAGQKVLKIDVTNPRAPSITGTVDLTTLNLKPFDGGTAIPRPYSAMESGGSIYVPLNNFDTNYNVAGPGFLAVINPTTSAVTAMELGTDCLNPLAVSASQGRLFVSCGGAAIYDSSFALVGTSGAGVLGLNPSALWTPPCDADAGCAPVLPSRHAIRGGRLYLGDQSGGRIFVADVLADGGFASRGAPIQACGAGPFGFSNVADLLVLP